MATGRIPIKPSYRLNIPDFSGGINTRDGISQINDNQLTNCQNVWYKGGLLKTRPGFVSGDGANGRWLLDVSPSQRPLKVYSNENNFRVINGVTYFLVCFQYADKIILRYYSDADKYFQIAEINEVPKTNGDYHCNIFQYNDEVYCFCSGYYEEEGIPYYIYKITPNLTITSEGILVDSDVKRITDEDMYAPTVLVNVPTNDGFINGIETMTARGAVAIEGYNFLGNTYKMLLHNASRYEVATSGNTVESDAMMYTLLHDTKDFIGHNITARVTNTNGTVYTHSLVINGDSVQTETSSEDGLLMRISGGYMLWFMDASTGGIKWVSREDFMENCIEVIAPCPNPAENYKKILNMTRNEWYGGGAEGIYGGIHLFMTGNTDEKEKALVCWSDFNKPLYFSENAYAYAGDKSQRATALAKQGESLFIFKERELFATKYVTNDTASAEQLENQSIVDLPANEVVFPMLQVHGYIGCDCPNTIKLCRNRLVWAHSDGKVYTLTSASQYNERSVFEVSGMIEPRLKEERKEDLRNALSVDWNNKYILIPDNNQMYVMDYDSYGYVNVSSYNKKDDAQLYIPWWIWNVPEYNLYASKGLDETTKQKVFCTIKSTVSVGDRFFVICLFESTADKIGTYSLPEILEVKENSKDIMPQFIVSGVTGPEYSRDVEEIDIYSMFQTKLFDFGAPTTKKTVPKIEIVFEGTEGEPITVSVITDESVSENIIALSQFSVNEASNLENILIRPEQKNNYRIGIKIERASNMSVDSMALQYRQTGGLK